MSITLTMTVAAWMIFSRGEKQPIPFSSYQSCVAALQEVRKINSGYMANEVICVENKP